jgi:hypothetical protein
VVLTADGEALVAWSDGRNGRDDIFLARSTDGGKSWEGDDRRMDMDEDGTAVSKYPKLARARDGRIALVWDDDRDGREAIYLRVRSAGPSAQWGPETSLTSPTRKIGARLPQAVWAGDGTLQLVWEQWDYTVSPTAVAKKVESKTLRPESR